MLFRNEESSLRLDIVNYEFPPDGGDPNSDDRNWLVLRATWNKEDGDVVKDSNSFLYVSDFQENFYFSVGARALGDGTFEVVVSFYLPNTMDGDDTAEITCTMDQKEMEALIGELDRLCEKFPDRT